MHDLISIIVPVYNVEQYLDKCIQSIVEQTYTNLEIILVDDGSPDNCPKMCDDWAKKDSRIKVIHKKNGGVSSARNAALDIAKGEYIGFVDSDDYIQPNMYEVMIQKIIKNDLELIECDYINSNDKQTIAVSDEIEFVEMDNAINEIINNGRISLYLFCKLFKKEFIEVIKFDTSITIAEDLIFCLEYISRIKKIGVNSSQLYIYNVENATSATTKFRKTNITIVKANEIILDLNLNYSKETSSHLKAKSILFAATYILNSIQNNIDDNEENIHYARTIVNKYYNEMKNHEYITTKKKMIIFCAMHCPKLYAKVKNLRK